MEACPACGRIAGFFLDSKLTPLFIVASLLVGFLAVMVIPREEEPQIIVPMLDVTTSMPGASPEEVEQRVTTPLESILHEISGVEFVYSTSSPGRSLVIVRFLVGTREEDALIKVYSKLYANGDKLPATASQPIVKLRSIDNVPILSLTMWGEHYSSAQLRSLAAAFQSSIQQVPEVSETQLIGGQPRALRVLLSDQKLEAYSISAEQVVSRICAANAQVEAGQFASGNQEIRVDAGEFIHSKDDLDRVTVGVSHGSPVYLRDVAANILDGPKDPTSYVSFGPAVGTKIEGTLPGSTYPAGTITVAKRKGTNATYVANAVLAKIAGMRKTTIPADLNITPTRNYGDTAKAKSDEGIIVRNAIILVDFIELRRRDGMPLAEAVIDAGAVRFRPMLLTAAAVVVGTSVILSDPIFQGLALSLIAGEFASTVLSRLAVPVLYYMVAKRAASVPERSQSSEELLHESTTSL